VAMTCSVAWPLERPVDREVVGAYAAWPVHRPDASDLIDASEIQDSSGLAFRDALVVVSTQRSQAQVLLTDRLTRGIRIGGVTVHNAFAG
jgi:predicted nucleic acid-binding protein